MGGDETSLRTRQGVHTEVDTPVPNTSEPILLKLERLSDRFGSGEAEVPWKLVSVTMFEAEAVGEAGRSRLRLNTMDDMHDGEEVGELLHVRQWPQTH